MRCSAHPLRPGQRRVCSARLFALTVACLVAAGCGVEEESDSNNHGFGWGYEAQATNGLTLRNEPDVVEPIDVAVLADIYDQTQACTGISMPGPFVIVVAKQLDEHGQPGGEFSGLTFYGPPLVLITQGVIWTSVAQHEFVHYLLDQSGFPRERNQVHDSPLFTECVHFCGLLGCT